jgi:acetyl-CoA C-acetyltransferase
MTSEAFLYDAIRTPRGKGKPTAALHEVKPIQLITGLLQELRTRHPDLDPAAIDDVVLGVVTPIGDQGMDIARTAVLMAGYPETTGGVQLNRFCASGLEAVNQAAQRVRSGWEDFILAGGVESMSRVKMGSDGGAWAMDPETALETGFIPQGISADLIATIDGFSRTDVDAYAADSHARAAKAWANGYFARSGGSQRPADPGPRPARPARDVRRDAGRAAVVVRGDRGARRVRLGRAGEVPDRRADLACAPCR